MSQSLLNTIYLALAYLALFSTAEFLYHKLKIKAEITRKYVHLVTGLLTLLFPPLIGNHWLVLLLCASFLVILLVSMHYNKLQSINAVQRTTRGSILYPIVVYCCYLVYLEYNQYAFYYIPILTLAICDPIAALVGKKWPLGSYVTFGNAKTLCGSISFFLTAWVISALILQSWVELDFVSTLLVALVISLATTISEALTHRGYDNLTIPFSALLVLIVFKEYIYVA